MIRLTAAVCTFLLLLNPAFSSTTDHVSPDNSVQDSSLTENKDGDCVICKKPVPPRQDHVESEEPNDSVLMFEDILPKPPRQYDKMAPPKPKGQPTVVYFHVTVMTLDSINEESMTYAADIFFAQSWLDHRLRFPSNMTSEYRLLPVSWLDRIWQPDSYFKNAKKVTFQDMTIPNHYIWLHQDKTILYMVKLTLVLSCAMSFHRYPHDTQQCAMKIESISYTTDDLVFVWDPMVPLVVDHIELPQLDLVKNTTGDCTQLYATGNFTCVEVVFTFKRRLGYYLFHTYIPTCLIVIMSWISFWIRPEAIPARVTLGVTSLLTLATQHSNSQKALPPVSYIKAIDIFMSSCMVFVFLSLMEYAIVNIILGDFLEPEECNARMRPRSAIVLNPMQMMSQTVEGAQQATTRLSSACPRHGHLAEEGGESSSLKFRQGVGGVTMETDGSGVTSSRSSRRKTLFQQKRERALLIDKISRVVFPLSFFILNLIYWVGYTVIGQGD